jgi:hypothetical protein
LEKFYEKVTNQLHKDLKQADTAIENKKQTPEWVDDKCDRLSDASPQTPEIQMASAAASDPNPQTATTPATPSLEEKIALLKAKFQQLQGITQEISASNQAKAASQNTALTGFVARGTIEAQSTTVAARAPSQEMGMSM